MCIVYGHVQATVAGVATLAVGYLLGREEQREEQRQQYMQQQAIHNNINKHTQPNPRDVDEPTDNENDACKVCYDNVACVILLNCRHQATCIRCTSQLSRCPICNSPIIHSIRAYRA